MYAYVVVEILSEIPLPCSLVMGAVGYLIFANVPFLEPLGDAVGPKLVDLDAGCALRPALCYLL